MKVYILVIMIAGDSMGKKKGSKNLSIIDSDLQIEGKIESKGRLIIKGTVRASIIGETIIIAEGGSVYSDANVESITIGGSFEGDIKASNELIILSTGKCSGKASCKDLVVENGGILNADVTCRTSKALNNEEISDFTPIDL